jgi:hypothetical protein
MKVVSLRGEFENSLWSGPGACLSSNDVASDRFWSISQVRFTSAQRKHANTMINNPLILLLKLNPGANAIFQSFG